MSEQEEDRIRISLSLTSSPSSPRVPMTISPTTTTTSSLHSLASQASSIPLQNIKIIFRGRLIPKDGDANVVKEYLLEDGCVVHCMGKPQADSVQSQQLSGLTSSSPSSAVASASSVAPSVVRPPPNAANAASAAVAVSANGVAGGHPLTIALRTMKSNHDANTYSTGVATLVKLLDNIISHPTEEKYRKVKRSNPAFQKRLGSLSGSVAAMAFIGFTVQQQGTSTSATTGEYILIASAEAWPRLLECQKLLKDAAAEAQRSRSLGSGVGGGGPSATNASTPGMNAPVPSTAGISNLSMPSMPAGMAGGPAQMADALLQNPSQLQSLLQNPTVRRMMENNPNIANNPMAQQSLDMIRQNPQMLEQAMRMMGSNPELRRNLVDNISSGAGGNPGGFDAEAMRRQMAMMQAMSGGGMGGAASAAAGQGDGSANQNTGNSAGDSDLTEEEMIAEAIARSLRET